MPAMASLRNGKPRKDGSQYVQVLYRMGGKQTSTSFQDLATATRFKELVEKFGPEQALTTLRRPGLSRRIRTRVDQRADRSKARRVADERNEVRTTPQG
ncbi:hypothetical protein R2360_16830 [Mycobacteroides chelonae]|uniref:Uncharacterized protein n=1 Tax=Mycobacteroides chelonae TaxID=1774 RepID=A0AB73U4F4_MYCCH|nr:hypothetical protein [Mycobacteroides chelonae]MEC4841105.1 hypothetical protein [Mycobacteroides chelonae]MEC4842752.1 hypothetical protein [Mycobacteroides chelonae]MEC4842763.1 hypothetical protein [Mycobacteroides chelonae]OLT73193.1 hypothetical protein BKG57_22150 [Mycobacteroides chelonae]QDF71823.1 hypothetical protein FJK96_17805 [Mycobacteroides chelonae]